MWGIDGKDGVELSIGRELFSQYEYTDVTPMVTMLEELVDIMRARQARMQGHVRVHTPTLDEPLYLLMVDENARPRRAAPRSPAGRGVAAEFGGRHHHRVRPTAPNSGNGTAAVRHLATVAVAITRRPARSVSAT